MAFHRNLEKNLIGECKSRELQNLVFKHDRLTLIEKSFSRSFQINVWIRAWARKDPWMIRAPKGVSRCISTHRDHEWSRKNRCRQWSKDMYACLPLGWWCWSDRTFARSSELWSTLGKQGPSAWLISKTPLLLLWDLASGWPIVKWWNWRGSHHWWPNAQRGDRHERTDAITKMPFWDGAQKVEADL